MLFSSLRNIDEAKWENRSRSIGYYAQSSARCGFLDGDWRTWEFQKCAGMVPCCVNWKGTDKYYKQYSSLIDSRWRRAKNFSQDYTEQQGQRFHLNMAFGWNLAFIFSVLSGHTRCARFTVRTCSNIHIFILKRVTRETRHTMRE